MAKPMVRIHDVETNEIVDREMTDIELVQYEKQQASELARHVEAEAKAAGKADLLVRLGITAEEAALLLS
jgi:hypothetical protein